MDEFSDFQMAVQKPTPPASNMVSLTPSYPAVNGGPAGKKGPGGQRFPDSSPVHTLTGHSKSDFIHSSQQPVTTTSKVSPLPLKPLVPPPTSSQKSGTSVGSRLANYDLGLSVPVPPQSNGFQGCSMELSSLNPPKTIKDQPTLRTQQDLLIGEEDRYSALRMLIETDINSTVSVFETSVSSVDSQPPPQPRPETEEPRPPPNPGLPSYKMNPPSFSNAFPVTNDSRPVVNNSNSSSALEFSMTTPADSPSTGGDSSSDFGDFQSFTGFASAPAPTAVEVNNQRPEQQASFSVNSNLPIASPQHSHSSHSVISSIMGNFQSGFQQPQPPHSVSFREPPKLDFMTMGGDNEGCESDEDFGDFVSVEPVVSKSQNVPVPPPPDISALSQETSVPEINCWNNHLDLSSLTITASAVENKHETASVLKSQHQPQCKQQNIGFDDYIFSGFSGVTNNTSNSPDQGQNGVDWLDKTQDTSIALPKTTEDQFQNLNQMNPQPATSTPTFIRTSLIRNDEVTDVDPIKWNQSVDDGSNDSAIDFNSFERKDFSSSGKSKFLDVSPETRSIASLDLGNYVTVDYGDTSGVNINNNNISNTSKVFMDQPMIMQQNVHGKTESPATPPTPNLDRHDAMGPEESVSYDEYDKYQCFRDECETEKERYANEWNRCLQACKLMVSDAFRVFNGVSTSEVIRDVVADEKGFFYVLNIAEIYRVSQRIQKSAERIGVESRLEHLTMEINNLWETLSAFLLGTCVSNEICQVSQELDFNESQEPFPSCGVCLCRVVTSETSHFLDYGGKFYHCQCANFWVNQVDPILPSLSYVSNVNSSDNSSSSGDNGSHQQKIMKISSLT